MSAQEKKNLWGTVPLMVEMQSEGGVAGALHGAIQSGALATTFTASQGLLLMIPNMYKIAGELTPTVIHVAARSLATQSLSIFGDQADVMAARATGFALLASNAVQETQDMAMVAHAATLESRIPFLHFFDGFRTSSEVNKIVPLSQEDIRSLIDEELILAHRARALSPDHPVIRGTALNPDVGFQARERANPYYEAAPAIVQSVMDRFAARTGRAYHLFDYVGAPDAERVIVVMGSGAETAEVTVDHLAARGEKVGVLKVRLFRPFSVEHMLAALPMTTRAIAVLDRTREPGSAGEPLYQDVVTALSEGRARGLWSSDPTVISGRYGLSSKEFTPAMVKAIFDELAKDEPKNHFTVGIDDDVCRTSLDYDTSFTVEDETEVQCVFWGLGSDGTVGANKNSIKIIGEETNNYAQGYFVYDSKKSGSVTISHLRFGPRPVRAPYQIEENQAQFVACHQFSFLERYDVLKYARQGGVFLLDSYYAPDQVWSHLPVEVRQTIREKNLQLYIINAQRVAREAGMAGRINTIMQTCFFALSRVLPQEEAIKQIKYSIRKSYSKRGEAVVQKNFQVVDAALARLHRVEIPPIEVEAAEDMLAMHRRLPVASNAPDFVRNVLGTIIAGEGDRLPVSAIPEDGTYPSATARWEKRNIAQEIPVWDSKLCIQCGKCVIVCPHAAIRMKVYDPAHLESAPAAFKVVDARFKEFPGMKYSLQVAPEDCTGCSLCVEACPAQAKLQPGHRAINMEAQPPLREQEVANWNFFDSLSSVDTDELNRAAIKNTQLLEPYFEFSGACSGCGETPYLKLVTQLFGDRMMVANATGCSSIYGANLPTTPWSTNREGRGPAWSNSLFEDNAEFGLGMRLAVDKQQQYAAELLERCADIVGSQLVQYLLHADQLQEAGLKAQRARIAQLKKVLQESEQAQESRVQALLGVADTFLKRSVWIVGGDGWAYDIGFGGLDHVLASGHNVNILVLDTEVYSNTGGQASKSTPRGAVARFAARGKPTPKKDLGMLAMAYGNVYVAQIALGANDQQALKAILEAEAYDGPSLIIAYSHCIAHGIDTKNGLEEQKRAVQSGYWLLYRYNPLLAEQGKSPLVLDSKAPSLPLGEFEFKESRYQVLRQNEPQRAEELVKQAQLDADARWKRYQMLAKLPTQE
jgi:pyruvate-ferredoxin/flavodoxin oxidoreductase